MYFYKFQIMYMKQNLVKTFKLSIICVHIVIYSRNFSVYSFQYYVCGRYQQVLLRLNPLNR